MTNPHHMPIAVLGAGSWGTALALYLARQGHPIRMWSVESSEITAMLADKANHKYMPGHTLPNHIIPSLDLVDAIKDVKDILVVVPSVGFRSTLQTLKPLLTPATRIICATKGLDSETGELLSEVAIDVLGEHFPFAVLSGPSFAREVAAGLPTAVVVASQHTGLAEDLKHKWQSDIFHIDVSDDVIGVELGGIIKNVIAIATGLSDGMQFGTNMRSAIITRGLDEMIRLGQAIGGKMQTFVGLSGLGDLILTCSDDQSRNRRLGLALGKGLSLEQAVAQIGQVVEGKRNAELINTFAKKHHIHLPICHAVWQMLEGKRSAKETIQSLL